MRITVGVCGATGVEMSCYLLKALKSIEDCEVHLILSEAARVTWELESSIPIEELVKMADHIYDEHNMAACISSGSFVTDGMIIMPCSMKTLAGIAAGYAENLNEGGAQSRSRPQGDAIGQSSYQKSKGGGRSGVCDCSADADIL